MRYVPRNDWCVIAIRKVEVLEGAIAMPDTAQAGKEFIVVAVGPKVENLKQGDKVLMTGGSVGQDGAVEITFYPLPDRSDMGLVRERNVALVIEEGDA